MVIPSFWNYLNAFLIAPFGPHLLMSTSFIIQVYHIPVVAPFSSIINAEIPNQTHVCRKLKNPMVFVGFQPPHLCCSTLSPDFCRSNSQFLTRSESWSCYEPAWRFFRRSPRGPQQPREFTWRQRPRRRRCWAEFMCCLKFLDGWRS